MEKKIKKLRILQKVCAVASMCVACALPLLVSDNSAQVSLAYGESSVVSSIEQPSEYPTDNEVTVSTAGFFNSIFSYQIHIYEDVQRSSAMIRNLSFDFRAYYQNNEITDLNIDEDFIYDYGNLSDYNFYNYNFYYDVEFQNVRLIEAVTSTTSKYFVTLYYNFYLSSSRDTTPIRQVTDTTDFMIVCLTDSFRSSQRVVNTVYLPNLLASVYNLDSNGVSLYNAAYENFVANAYNLGFYSLSAVNNAYIQGFNDGVVSGANGNFSFTNFIKTVFGAPYEMFKHAFNWRLTDESGNVVFDAFPIVSFVLTIGIVLAALQVMKRIR